MEVMTREELVKQKAQEFVSSGEYSPTLTECFIAGAEWENKRIIEKACEWLYKFNQNQAIKYGPRASMSCSDYTISVYDFRKAMEE